MIEEKIKKYAKLLTNYSLQVKDGSEVLIQGEDVSLPLIKAVYQEVLKQGGHPLVITKFAEQEELFFRSASRQQLEYVSPFDEFLMKNIDCYLRILGHNNTKSLAGIDPEKIKLRSLAQKNISKLMNDRAAAGDLNWNICQFPTQSDAQEAGMSFFDYQEFVYQACHLDRNDPVAYWQEFGQEMKRIAAILNKKTDFHFVAEGTDLYCKTSGRIWTVDQGKENYPGGEIFTGPVEDSVHGKIRFSYPGIYSGQEVEDIKLEFAAGKVISAEASQGEDLLNSLLEADRGARFVGEIAVGCNQGIQRFTRNMLFDEKMGGTIHLALGMSYPETLGKNESTIHWDMLCDMKNGGKIYADDELIYEDGKFII